MIVSSGTKKPNIHASAYVAPSAVVSGDVTIEEGCAVLRASGGSAMQFPLSVGESCIIGPGAFLSGATIEPACFIAAHSVIRNGATVPENTTVGEIPKGFFGEIFNVEESPEMRAQAAENYAGFLRKIHAQDAAIAEPAKKAAPKAPPRKTAEEPAPMQNTEVEKVVDVMFVELEEARLRREAAIERQKKGKR